MGFLPALFHSFIKRFCFLQIASYLVLFYLLQLPFAGSYAGTIFDQKLSLGYKYRAENHYAVRSLPNYLAVRSHDLRQSRRPKH